MSRVLHQRAGGVFLNSYVTNAAAQHRRLCRGTLQRMMERLWTPLIAYAGRPEVAQRQFLLNQSKMSGFAFSCQLNGQIGDAALLSAFTSAVLKGFDVVNVSIDAQNAHTEPSSFQGWFTVAHTRQLADWQPLATLTEASRPSGRVPRLITVPFVSHVEAIHTASTPLITHLSFRSPFFDTVAAELQRSGEPCPQLRACLALSEPRQRFLSFQRLSGQSV